MEVYNVVHTNPFITKVIDYINDSNSPAFEYSKNPDGFLSVQNEFGLTNREAIEATYTTKYLKKFIGKPVSQLPLRIGTTLAVEKQKANLAGILTDGLQVVDYNVVGFKARALAALESDSRYEVVDTLKPIKGKQAKGITKDSYPNMTVWIWCRSLATAANNFEGEIFNVTPFVIAVDTDMGHNGGQFDIKLPPLVCEKNEKTGSWTVKKSSIQFYQTVNSTTATKDLKYVADENLYSIDAQGDPLRNSFLFHTILSTNDLVFIRFETLQIEKTRRSAQSSPLFINKSNLPDNIYDMIGLIDVNGIRVVPTGPEVTVQVTGRDLSKLFIEDQSQFFFLELSQGMLGAAGSATSKVGGIQSRLGVTEGFQYLNLYSNNTIDKVFEFTINQLSNITIIPDTLLSAYGNRRNTLFTSNTDPAASNFNNNIRNLQASVLSQIGSLRKTNGFNSSTNIDEQNIIQQIFIELKRFLVAIRTFQVRKTEGSATAGWNAFTYINNINIPEPIIEDRFPSYFATNLFNLVSTRETPEIYPIVSQVDQIIDLEGSMPVFKEGLQKQLASGIWQIIKLVIDSAVLDRQIVDSSISTADGSLINFFRKACQEPLVEFYMDTYGDMYNLVIRKPMTDRASIVSMLQATIETDPVDNTTQDPDQNIAPAIVEIGAEDVLDENLYFDDSETYSWFHLVPQANFCGGTAFSLSYLPAILLDEYAQVWGSKSLQIQHNYMPLTMRDIDQKQLSSIEQQAIEDMRYLIESYAYRPFTRKGIIKTNGDRKIKIGNLIRYKPTGEIFYVDSVKQSLAVGDAAIDRTSTIEVSRGMVEQLIYGVRLIPDEITEGNEGGVVASYFNIVNTVPNVGATLQSIVQSKAPVTTTTTTPGSTVLTPSSDTTTLSTSIIQSGNVDTYLLDKYTSTKGRFIQLINAINNQGYKVVVVSTVRTYEQQYALWKQNSKNAQAGHSRHEEGLAIDINLITPSGAHITKRYNTQAEWLNTGIPQLAQSMGFIWGGNAFKGYTDSSHFEIDSTITLPTSVTTTSYTEDSIPVAQLNNDLSKVFSNFKVNKDVFNFFLKKRQSEDQYKKVTSTTVLNADGGVLPDVIINTRKTTQTESPEDQALDLLANKIQNKNNFY